MSNSSSSRHFGSSVARTGNRTADRGSGFLSPVDDLVESDLCGGRHRRDSSCCRPSRGSSRTGPIRRRGSGSRGSDSGNGPASLPLRSGSQKPLIQLRCRLSPVSSRPSMEPCTSANSDATHGNELWRTNGTSQGTQMVADIDPGAGSPAPHDLVAFNGTVDFAAHNGSTPQT